MLYKYLKSYIIIPLIAAVFLAGTSGSCESKAKFKRAARRATDTLFCKRLLTFPLWSQVTNVSWYKPFEVVEGVSFPDIDRDDMPRSSKPLAPEIAELATSYGKATTSSAILVMKEGKILYEWYGPNATPFTKTNSMSMAKTVLAILIGIAIDDGYIGHESEPIGKYITEWAGDDRGKITIEELLRMHSVFRDQGQMMNPLSDLVAMHLGSYSLELVLNTPLKQPRDLKPKFEYSNINAQVLGIVLERATKKTYAKYLSEKIWKRMGLSTGSVWLDREGGQAKTYSALFATPLDWLKIGQMLLNEGTYARKRIVSRHWVFRMRVPGIEPDHGYLLWLGSNSKDGFQRKKRKNDFVAEDLFHLTGMGRQMVYILPSEKLVIVRVGEAPPDGTWDDATLPNLFMNK